MFRRVWFDIVGVCQARCAWCQTGWRNRQGLRSGAGCVASFDFARAIDYMARQGIIGPTSMIELYNFGEPFLHPQFQEILDWLSHTGLPFGLSTNASRVQALQGPVLQNLQYLAFSMPGFSQDSYNRMHGFDFEKITVNIATIIRNFRDRGFRGLSYIAYHVYQFNQDELDRACAFAAENGLGLQAYYAFFNDLNTYLSYLESTMPYEQLKRASQDLVLYYLDGLRASQPPDFQCANWFDLTLNERCQVVLCCAADKNEGPTILGDLFQMSHDAIVQAKQHEICQRCVSSGCAYLVNNPRYVRKVSPPRP